MAISPNYSDLGDTLIPSNRLNTLLNKLTKVTDLFVCDAAGIFDSYINNLTATDQRELFALWQGNGQLLIDYIAQVNALAAAQTDKQIELKYPLSVDVDGNILVDSTIYSQAINLLLEDVSATDTVESVSLDKCYNGTFDMSFLYELAGVVSSAKEVDIELNNADGTNPLVVTTIVLDTVTTVPELREVSGLVLTGQDKVNFTYRGLASGDAITIDTIALSDV